MKDRDGTNYDRDKMNELLSRFGYKVTPLDNLTAEVRCVRFTHSCLLRSISNFKATLA